MSHCTGSVAKPPDIRFEAKNVRSYKVFQSFRQPMTVTVQRADLTQVRISLRKCQRLLIPATYQFVFPQINTEYQEPELDPDFLVADDNDLLLADDNDFLLLS